MAKVWDSCICCFQSIEPSEKQNWRRCRRCRWLERVVLTPMLVAIGFLYFRAFSREIRPSISALTNLTGLSFAMIGAWLLASGYLEIFAKAAGGWGGGDETFRRYGFRHYLKRLIGLGLLVVGFFLQALSGLL